MKVLFLICLLFAAIYCQTSINIYNNGNGCNSPCPSAPKRYRFGVHANGGDTTFLWDASYIQKVLEFVPSLKTMVDIVPIYFSNITQDILLPVLNCEYDVAFVDVGVTQQRLDLGLKFTDPIYFVTNQSYVSFFVNIPLSSTSDLCDTNCNQAGVCSSLTVQNLVDYANANGKTTINLRYDSGSYRKQVVEDLQQQFITDGYTGTIVISTYPSDQDPSQYAVNAAANTLEVVYANIPTTSCPAIKTQTSKVSVAPLITNVNPRPGFAVCPKQTGLLDLLNSGIRQYRATTEICKNLEAYYAYCVHDPAIFNEKEDTCYNLVKKC